MTFHMTYQKGSSGMKPHICALVGAQYGSEGKGTIAYELAWDYGIHVRTGAPNAGHTIRHEDRTWKMRSVPCGWVNEEALLVIGAGALIDPALLLDEIDAIEQAGYEISSRIYVDYKAAILASSHHKYEGGVEGIAHERIGSTGEGVGITRMAKIARGTVDLKPFDVFRQAIDEPLLKGRVTLIDTAEMLSRQAEMESILLEGTQGSGLSLTHGEWPYCTSTDTNAAQLCADAGLPPKIQRVILVARTFPIRVAGHSGPLHGETTWDAIGVKPEQTTVTLKTRRVGIWDEQLVKRAIRLNGADEIALTFLDYVYPEIAGVTLWDQLGTHELEFIDYIEGRVGVPVTMVGVGGDDFNVLRSPVRGSVRVNR